MSWTQTNLDTNFLWQSVAMNADGSKALACANGVWSLSNDVWSQVIDLELYWTSVAMNADGSKALACAYGGVWSFDANSGGWSQVTGLGELNWTSVAMNADGSKALACAYGDSVWFLSNGVWSQVAFLYNWRSVAMNADGLKALACAYGDGVWSFDANSGGWSQVTGLDELNWTSVAMNANGSKALACAYNGGVWSFNADDGWSQVMVSGNFLWKSVAMNADGSKALACAAGGGAGGGVWSFNADDGWSQVMDLGNFFWKSVAMNADGSKALACDGGVWYYSAPPPSICLLPDCDILLANFSLKNITELTLTDEVLGYFSKEPQKIKKILKRTHLIKSLEDTNKPYLIAKNAFGANVPDKDIHLSGHHRVITRADDNHFLGVQAFKLPNCKKATNNPDEVTYYHIVLHNRGEGLIVNNLPVEDCIEEI